MTDDNMLDRLDIWWATLTEEQQDGLRNLHTGDSLSGEYVVGLTHALGSGPAGYAWEGGDYVWHVDPRLGSFLAAKREVEPRSAE